MFARSGTVSSPEALAVSSPERVRRAHRFLIKAASKSVDRAGSRDQAMRIGVTANVGGDLRRSTVFRRSTRGPPIRRSQSPFEVMRNALCPMPYPGSIRHGDENGSPLPYHRSPCHVGQSVVKDQVAHVVGRATWRQLVKHFMGEGGVACQLSQNAVDLSHDSGRPQRAESSMLRPLDGSGPSRHGASISLRHRPIRHCDVLIVMRGRGVVDGRLSVASLFFIARRTDSTVRRTIESNARTPF